MQNNKYSPLIELVSRKAEREKKKAIMVTDFVSCSREMGSGE